MYASDGLPQHYYDVASDKSLMKRMKADVFAALEEQGEMTALEVCLYTGIMPMFDGEVEDFITEWVESK